MLILLVRIVSIFIIVCECEGMEILTNRQEEENQICMCNDKREFNELELSNQGLLVLVATASCNKSIYLIALSVGWRS